MKSSDVEPTLEHLHELRFCENDGGIGVLIRKLEEAKK